jgi:hypothetical protein
VPLNNRAAWGVSPRGDRRRERATGAGSGAATSARRRHPRRFYFSSKRREFAGEGAFAAVGRVAMDRAFFDSAIEFGTHLADVFGGDFLVFRVEGGPGFARECLDAVERAAVARGADFRLTGAFGGGFDVGHI